MACFHEILDYPSVIVDIIMDYIKQPQTWAGLLMHDRIMFHYSTYFSHQWNLKPINAVQWVVKGTGIYYISVEKNMSILRRFDINTSKSCRLSLKDRFNGGLGLFQNRVCVVGGSVNTSEEVYMLDYTEPYVTYTQLPSMRYKRSNPVCAWDYHTLYVIGTTIEVFDGTQWEVVTFRIGENTQPNRRSFYHFVHPVASELPLGRKCAVLHGNKLVIVGHTSWNKFDGFKRYAYVIDITTRILEEIEPPPNYDPTASLVVLNDHIYCVSPQNHVLEARAYQLRSYTHWVEHEINTTIRQHIIFPWPTYNVDVM